METGASVPLSWDGEMPGVGLGRAWPLRGEQAGHSGLQTHHRACTGPQGRNKDALGVGGGAAWAPLSRRLGLWRLLLSQLSCRQLSFSAVSAATETMSP